MRPSRYFRIIASSLATSAGLDTAAGFFFSNRVKIVHETDNQISNKSMMTGRSSTYKNEVILRMDGEKEVH